MVRNETFSMWMLRRKKIKSFEKKLIKKFLMVFHLLKNFMSFFFNFYEFSMSVSKNISSSFSEFSWKKIKHEKKTLILKNTSEIFSKLTVFFIFDFFKTFNFITEKIAESSPNIFLVFQDFLNFQKKDHFFQQKKYRKINFYEKKWENKMKLSPKIFTNQTPSNSNMPISVGNSIKNH